MVRPLNIPQKKLLNRLIPIILVLVLALGTNACEFLDSGKGYYHSSNEDFMEELKKELDTKGFQYTVDKEGYIRFAPKDEARFYEIENKIFRGFAFQINSRWYDIFDESSDLNKILEFSNGFKSGSQKFMEVLKQELDSAGVEYLLDERGFIRYRAVDKKRFKDLQVLVEAMVSGKRGLGPAAGDIDHDFLKALKEELDSAGVGYSIDDEAAVRFRSGDKHVFKNIVLKLHKMHHLGDAARILNDEKRERLIRLLEEKKVEHLILINSHGIWVRWYPENTAQRNEIWSVVNSLGCGSPSIDKNESKGAPSSKEISQGILVQQMCSTLPERK